MKQLFFLFCFIVASCPLFSQAEFMPIGFRFTSFVSAMSFSGTLVTTSEKDSIIDGVNVRKLSRKYVNINGYYVPNNYNVFVRQKMILFFDTILAQRHLLFCLKISTTLVILFILNVVLHQIKPR
jgi:hypothetical protein